MIRFLRRPALMFVLGAVLAAAAFAGRAAYAALAGDRVAACYVPKTGALYVIGRDGAPTGCAEGHLPIDWSIRGPQGPAGVFSGTFKSPNGAYAISVTDAGIVLTGPGSAVRLTGANVSVEGGTITAQAGTTIGLASGTATSILGGTDLTVAANRNLALESGGHTTLQTGLDLGVDVGRNLAVTIDGTTTVQGTGNISIITAAELLLRGAQSANLESSGPVKVEGSTATLKASGSVMIKGSSILEN